MNAVLTTLLAHPLVAAVREIGRVRRVPAVLVGGAVRDALLGRESHDFDFAVQGDAVALGRAVANALRADFYVMDAERGTARVLVPNEQHAPLVMDFAACRGATWRDDLIGRDFTLNAIALDLATGDVIDATGGVDDIARRTVRATTAHAISDDPVRALRAVRIAFRSGFEIEPATVALLKATGAAILHPSAERLRDELFGIFDLAGAAHATRMLDDLGLLTHLVPEIEPMRLQQQSTPHRFTVLEHTWRVMQKVDWMSSNWMRGDQSLHPLIHSSFNESLISYLDSSLAEDRSVRSLLHFAALMHDCAKPNTASADADGRLHFYGHERDGADMASARARALKLSGDEVQWVRVFITNHMRPNQMARMPQPPTPRTLVRFFRDAGETAPALALFALADCWGKRGDETTDADCAPSRAIAALLIDRYYTRFEKSVAPAPLITGRDLIEMGVSQGPRIGEILHAVREAHMAGEIDTREQALAMADAMRRA